MPCRHCSSLRFSRSSSRSRSDDLLRQSRRRNEFAAPAPLAALRRPPVRATLRRHPLASPLDKLTPLEETAGLRVRTAGSVIIRQRPGTARDLLFLTLEDETGLSQAVVMPDRLKKHRRTIATAARSSRLPA